MDFFSIFRVNRKNTTFFGWLSIVITIITIPYYAASFYMGIANPQQSSGNPLGSIISIVYALLFIAIFYYFKVLLNEKYKFFKADKAISVFIYLNILVTVLIEVLSYNPGLEALRTVITFASLVPIGIASIAIGVKLMSLNNTLYGIKKSLSINLIASGILFASVVLFLLGIIPSLIVDALLGVLFLREAAASTKD